MCKPNENLANCEFFIICIMKIREVLELCSELLQANISGSQGEGEGGPWSPKYLITVMPGAPNEILWSPGGLAFLFWRTACFRPELWSPKPLCDTEHSGLFSLDPLLGTKLGHNIQVYLRNTDPRSFLNICQIKVIF